LFILVTSCFIEVRNPWGLKKPVIQKSGGLTLVTHLESYAFLLFNEVNHAPRLGYNHEISAPVVSYIQSVGTLESNTLSIAFASEGVMMIYPSIDRIISLNYTATLLIIPDIL
jgi:hypothetical protein